MNDIKHAPTTLGIGDAPDKTWHRVQFELSSDLMQKMSYVRDRTGQSYSWIIRAAISYYEKCGSPFSKGNIVIYGENHDGSRMAMNALFGDYHKNILQNLADAHERTQPWVIRSALRHYLSVLRDIQDA